MITLKILLMILCVLVLCILILYLAFRILTSHSKIDDSKSILPEQLGKKEKLIKTEKEMRASCLSQSLKDDDKTKGGIGQHKLELSLKQKFKTTSEWNDEKIKSASIENEADENRPREEIEKKERQSISDILMDRAIHEDNTRIVRINKENEKKLSRGPRLRL